MVGLNQAFSHSVLMPGELSERVDLSTTLGHRLTEVILKGDAAAGSQDLKVDLNNLKNKQEAVLRAISAIKKHIQDFQQARVNPNDPAYAEAQSKLEALSKEAEILAKRIAELSESSSKITEARFELHNSVLEMLTAPKAFMPMDVAFSIYRTLRHSAFEQSGKFREVVLGGEPTNSLNAYA